MAYDLVKWLIEKMGVFVGIISVEMHNHSWSVSFTGHVSWPAKIFETSQQYMWPLGKLQDPIVFIEVLNTKFSR